MRQVFGNGYMTDEGFISIDDMNNMARDLDLAVIPVNVPINHAVSLQNSEWYNVELTGKNQLPPFLAFIVGANYGDPARGRRRDQCFAESGHRAARRGNGWSASGVFR